MNKKESLIKEVNKLVKTRNSDDIDKAEMLLENYLKENPKDIEMWIRFCVFELQPPLCDGERGLKYIYKVLEMDPNNFEAVMLMACIDRFLASANSVIIKLSQIRTDDPEKLSMIEYAKAWSYERIEEDNYKAIHGNLDGFYKSPENYKQTEEALKKSINLYPCHVYSYKHLARIYNRCNKKASAAKLIKKAIKNVKVIYKEGEGLDGDWTCPQEYFNELVKGTHISESLYKSLGEYLVEYSKP